MPSTEMRPTVHWLILAGSLFVRNTTICLEFGGEGCRPAHAGHARESARRASLQLDRLTSVSTAAARAPPPTSMPSSDLEAG